MTDWTNTIWDKDVWAFDGFVGSLESPTSNVIGADGNTDANDEDMLGTNFQEI